MTRVLTDDALWAFQDAQWVCSAINTLSEARLKEIFEGVAVCWIDFRPARLDQERPTAEMILRTPKGLQGHGYWSVDLNAAQRRFFEQMRQTHPSLVWMPVEALLGFVKPTRVCDWAGHVIDWRPLGPQTLGRVIGQDEQATRPPRRWFQVTWTLKAGLALVIVLGYQRVRRLPISAGWTGLLLANALAAGLLVTLFMTHEVPKTQPMAQPLGIQGLSKSTQQSLREPLASLWLLEDLKLVQQWVMASQFLSLTHVDWRVDDMRLGLVWQNPANTPLSEWDNERRQLERRVLEFDVNIRWDASPLTQNPKKEEGLSALWTLN